jgi:amino-acid N-acetyltransferase
LRRNHGVAAVSSVTIAPARPADLAEILALLQRSRLPAAGLASHVWSAVVARDGGRVVGSAALELYGGSALLRSVAVEAELRGQGVGRRLATAALALAREHGVLTVYLLTETAAEFFARLGFSRLDREEVDPAVRQSAEFREACPASAVSMVLRLGDAPSDPRIRAV